MYKISHAKIINNNHCSKNIRTNVISSITELSYTVHRSYANFNKASHAYYNLPSL